MANDNEVKKWFSYGLHNKNYDEVKQLAINLLTNMDNPKNFNVRWTVHDFEKKFQFVLRKGWTDLARSPLIDTTDDKNYTFYLVLFAVLDQKKVDCHPIDVHYKHSGPHGSAELKNIGKRIAATIT